MLAFILSSLSFVAPSLAIEGVLEVNFQKVAHPLNDGSELSKRAQAPDAHLLDHIANQRFFYTSQVSIGTPAQKVALLMDTGSSDTWVMSGNTRGSAGTTFNSANSQSYHANGTNWQLQYGIGSASGSWGTDTFTIGGATLKSLSFGVASNVQQINQGIVGLGRKQAESTTKQGYTYNNLPLQMKQEGLIKTAAYSLFLDDINAQSGTILFGGVDHSKYSGQLVSMPVAHPRHLAVSLKGIYGDGRATENNMQGSAVAVLDSGTSLTYVDAGTLANIRVSLNANPSFAINERYYCDCNITKNLIFDFGDTKVAVPAYNFLWPIEELVPGRQAAAQFPYNSCYLGIEQTSAGENFMLLGDNVLRGMYVVYDVENNQIAIAPSANKGASNVEAIVSPRIPGARSFQHAQQQLELEQFEQLEQEPALEA